MKVSKHLTINIGQYESLKIGVDESPSFKDADEIIISELTRIDIPVDDKIRQCLKWKLES